LSKRNFLMPSESSLQFSIKGWTILEKSIGGCTPSRTGRNGIGTESADVFLDN
jgi:hypothetical protein